MKTLEAFEQQEELEFDKWIQSLDEIDEQMYYHIGCGYVPPNFQDERYIQNGECNRESEAGVRYYETAAHINGKYYYLGEMPSFEPDVY